MHVTARSYLTAGVAFIGAGAIAISPISPVNPLLQDVQIPAAAVSSAPVELAALVNPIELWAEVFATTAGNLGTLAEQLLAAPAPILANIANNQLVSGSRLAELVGLGATGFFTGVGAIPAGLEAAAEQILSGDIFGGTSTAVNALLGPILQAAFAVLFTPGGLDDIVAILQNPFKNIVDVIAVAVPGLLGVGLPFLTFAVTPIFQVAATSQAVYDGIVAGDFEAALNAVISFPSDLANTILNGGTGEFSFGGGLFGEFGVFEGLLNFRQAIADAINPPALFPTPESRTSLLMADEVPDLEPLAITVSTTGAAAKSAPLQELATAEGAGTGAEAPGPSPEPTPPPVTDEDSEDTTGEDETSSPQDDAESEKKTSKREQRDSSETRSDRNDTKSAQRAERADKKEAKARAGADRSSSDE